MSVLYLVGDGLGNQLQLLPAFNRLVKEYSDVDVCCMIPGTEHYTKFIFGSRVIPFPPDFSAYEKVIASPLCSKITKQEVPKGFSEVEAALKMTGLDYSDKDFEVRLDAPRRDDYPEFILHDGFNKNSRVKDRWLVKSWPFWKELASGTVDRAASIGSPDELIPGTEDFTGLSLEETTSVIRSARLLICNDTGTYHLACVLGTPCLVFFSCTSLKKNYDPRFHRSATVIRRTDLPCSPCQPEEYFTGVDPWRENKFKCGWECQKLPVEEMRQSFFDALNPPIMVMAVTTYNRKEYLKRFIESWDRTRNRQYLWTLIVADDGSTDGTLEWLRSYKNRDIDIRIIEAKRRGVHYLTNRILKMCSEELFFSFGFKADDDMYFKCPGWDSAYYQAYRRTGYDHLCHFDKQWAKRYCGGKEYLPIEKLRGLESELMPEGVFGCFWTFTQDVIDKVGYFDVENFGRCVFGHGDYTARCGRMGFNGSVRHFGVPDSAKYLGMPEEGYKQAIPAENRPDNTPTDRARKLALIRDFGRGFVDYGEPDRDMDGNLV